MSLRRRLQTGAEHHAPQSSPTPGRSRLSNLNGSIPFPEYTPPTCPLSADAQRAISNIRTLHNSAKLKKHLSQAIKNITDTTVANNDRIWERKRQVEKNARKRQRDGQDDEEIPAEHKDLEIHTKHLAKKVNIWTEQAELAMRVLIDKGDEVERNDLVVRDVCGKLAEANPAPPMRRTRGQEDGEEAKQDGVVVSAVELLDQIKEEYRSKYEAESMTKRYASHNDYKSFKRVVHDSLHPDGDLPLPKESTWFPSDRSHPSAQANGQAEEDSSDDEIVIERVVKDLKCPLTFAIFRFPYTNNKCNHSFEKEAIIEYHGKNATNQGGQRVVKCPAVGCENLIAMKDMYDDQLVMRQVRRATQRERSEDSDDEDDAPRGTQRNRPEELDDESTFLDVDDEERRRSVKREKMGSRPPPTLTQVDTDGEDEDDEDE
ncbi:uncharacterized protein EAF01_010550 [Botrytis porri]|uniref:SP-RING-type domain-containing protein n=1 Tax=Botrytis porri TaxID=87229 RepID=A0A4Z1KJE6_9HELO|nr:uncharacterized protein EAF01_010550 [Botrytis porri]KAF7890741.1 hypothetical protein EAF01_010550 [Botrytis porri]TGO86177.1 hypothetical protein BPOR_0327g00090 [Botrytis porri]